MIFTNPLDRKGLLILFVKFFLMSIVAVLCSLVFPAIPSPAQTDVTAQEMKEVMYNLFDAINPDGNSSGPTGSELAWSESYILNGFVSAYEATEDTLFLSRLCEHAQNIFLIRDDFRGIKDEIRGRLMHAWSSTQYTNGKNYAWIVHAGMVTFPLARFVYLVHRDETLSEQFGARADFILARIEETVKCFDDSFRHGPEEEEGHYVGDYFDHELPLNQQNALGRTLVTLWLATGDMSYRVKASALAKYFKNRLWYNGRKMAYSWAYSPGNDGSGEDTDDISHAAINADFAFQCYRAGIVFTRKEMRKFAGTVTRIFASGDSVSVLIDGYGGVKPSFTFQAGRWLHLAYVEQPVADVLYRHLAKPLKEGAVPPVTAFITAAYFYEVRTLDFKKESPAKMP